MIIINKIRNHSKISPAIVSAPNRVSPTNKGLNIKTGKKGISLLPDSSVSCIMVKQDEETGTITNNMKYGNPGKLQRTKELFSFVPWVIIFICPICYLGYLVKSAFFTHLYDVKFANANLFDIFFQLVQYFAIGGMVLWLAFMLLTLLSFILYGDLDRLGR